MSIRLDPRRVNALKHLAGEAGMRPGDLVRQWVEERLDASRTGAEPATDGLKAQLEALVARVEALESSGTQPAQPTDVPTEPETGPKRQKRTKVSAAPSSERVALHDEMIELITDRGPMSAADLAKAVTERGRYTPPRSGKPIDAATISQRVSNPTYRSRFTRNEGLIGLAEPTEA
jgi:hypothetical protein